jgi:aminopeptidase N
MYTKTALISGLLLFLTIAAVCPNTFSQTSTKLSSAPKIDVLNYKIEAVLSPDSHELSAATAITFKPLEGMDLAIFELSENLWVQKVLDQEGIELEFAQDEIAPGYLSVYFSPSLSAGSTVTISVEFRGGFDRDRFSRLFSRDDSSAYIGMEGTYLLYASKWFPIHGFLADRATGTLEVTVPLGMTVIGPGIQLPVVTKGISETFRWNTEVPILAGSFVAGRYFQRKMKIGDFSIECFARQNKLEAMQSSAEAVAKILGFYQKAYGPSASGNSYRLVEVDDQLAQQPGMLGTIFITRQELAQSSPPVRQLARRIAYQWWQETIGVESPSDLWLVDGMAYFSAVQYFAKTEDSDAYKDEIDKLAVLALKFEKKSSVRRGLELGYRNDQYESVVAGKGAWVLNMLRGILGEVKFAGLIQQYVKKCAGGGGSTAIFQQLAEKLYGQELGWFFAEWIDTIGVPELQTDYVVFKTLNGFRVSGTVRQDSDLFRMPVEIAIVSGSKEETITVDLKGKTSTFDVNTFSMPEKIALDPNNKVLRDSRELQTSVQISLGNDLKQSGSFVEAVRAYEAAIRLTPNRSLAHFRLAEVFFEQLNLQSAANSFRDALNGDRDPAWIEVWCYIYLGKVYDILGQRQRAMAEYTKAVNTKDDTNGAQAEAQKWLADPYTKESTTMNPD